jgi:DNA processing protein
VVSGAAIGIDGAAHRGSLAVDGATVAVLACGVDRVYPAGHATLLERIAATGLVVSEYPPGSVPARHRFLVRNRLIHRSVGLNDHGVAQVSSSDVSGGTARLRDRCRA